MSNNQCCQLQLLVNLQIPSMEFHLGHLIQSAKGLIQEKELVPKKIGTKQGHTLAHPTTEFMRVFISYSCQLEGRKNFICASNSFCLIHLLNQEGQNDITKYRLVLQEQILLQHITHAPLGIFFTIKDNSP